VIKG
jgi:hypothetical protein